MPSVFRDLGVRRSGPQLRTHFAITRNNRAKMFLKGQTWLPGVIGRIRINCLKKRLYLLLDRRVTCPCQKLAIRLPRHVPRRNPRRSLHRDPFRKASQKLLAGE